MTRDVLVVGAGVVGCSAARWLAPEHDVCVLDRSGVASETTAKASGLITIVPDLPGHPDAARHAVDFFESYDGTGNFSYTRRPSVHLVADHEVEWARGQAAQLSDAGFDVAYYDAAALEERYPGVFVLDDFAGGMEFRETGWVDPYTYATTLKDDAAAAGATFETGVTVEDVTVEDGAVTGVDTDAGHVAADHVVVAAGWHTRRLLADHLELPLRPFRWQAVNLETDRGFDDSFPIAWDTQTGLYWRPEHNGDLHVGGGTYFVDDPGDRRESVTEAFRTLVATRIADRVAGVADARVVGEDCCPTGDAATPDDRPILDAPAEGPGGLVVATGSPIGGVMTSPVVGAAVEALVTGTDAPFPLSPFALDRFTDRSADFDCGYVRGEVGPDAAI